MVDYPLFYIAILDHQRFKFIYGPGSSCHALFWTSSCRCCDHLFYRSFLSTPYFFLVTWPWSGKSTIHSWFPHLNELSVMIIPTMGVHDGLLLLDEWLMTLYSRSMLVNDGFVNKVWEPPITRNMPPAKTVMIEDSKLQGICKRLPNMFNVIVFIFLLWKADWRILLHCFMLKNGYLPAHDGE